MTDHTRKNAKDRLTLGHIYILFSVVVPTFLFVIFCVMIKAPINLMVFLVVPLASLADIVYHGTIKKHVISMCFRYVLMGVLWGFHCNHRYSSAEECLYDIDSYMKWIILGVVVMYMMPFFIMFLQFTYKHD